MYQSFKNQFTTPTPQSHHGIAVVTRLYRGCIVAASRLHRESRGVSPFLRRLAGLTEIRRCLADSRAYLYRAVSRVSQFFTEAISRVSRVYCGVYRGCIAGLAEEDSHVSRLSRGVSRLFHSVSHVSRIVNLLCIPVSLRSFKRSVDLDVVPCILVLSDHLLGFTRRT